MKRDFDLIREILLKLEEKEEYDNSEGLCISNVPFNNVAFHCKLLYEAGLIDFYSPILSSAGIISFNIGNLTWNGFDYLETVRDQGQWNKIKQTIRNAAVPMSIELIKELGLSLLRSKLGLQ